MSVQLSKNGGDPTVTIIIGQAQKGKYLVGLTTATGEKEIARKASDSTVADTFPLGPIEPLDDAILHWDIDIVAASDQPGQKFSASVHVSQGGSLAGNGLFEYDGDLDRFKKIVGIVRLEVI